MSDAPQRWSGATVEVSMGSTGGSLTASLDLDAGALERQRGGQPARRWVLVAHHLEALRAEALAALEEGDVHVRDQFADGGTTFVIRSGQRTCTRLYETEGGQWCAGVQLIWETVTGRHPEPGDRVKVEMNEADRSWGLEVDLEAARLRWTGTREDRGEQLLAYLPANQLAWMARRLLSEGEHEARGAKPGDDLCWVLRLDGETHSFSGCAEEHWRWGWHASLWQWVAAREAESG